MQFCLTHEMVEHTVWGGITLRGANEDDLKLASAEAAINRYFDRLVSDVWASRYCGASLGSTLRSYGTFLAVKAKFLNSLRPVVVADGRFGPED